MSNQSYMVATFRDANTLIKAVKSVRAKQFRVYDIYSPYPIHGMDEVMGVRRTRLPWVTLIVGVSAGLSAVLLQFYTSVADWNLNVGGKPDNSALAFVPITFELTILLGGLSTIFALLLRTRMFPGKKERLPAEGVTDDTFALVLRKRDASFNAAQARQVLEQNGAESVQEKEGEL
ncbi:MAG TPA: DUF3341 domain-containing protein [Candidatus Angelobacter sp.]|nr:DUF3341 domain-containing protein [Candidatus Angelobacter sp.]